MSIPKVMGPMSLPLPRLEHSIFNILHFFILLTYLAGPITYPARAASPSPSDCYDLCTPFSCGDINFTFPFSDSEKSDLGLFSCGLPGYQISCDNSSSGGPSLMLTGRPYRVKVFSSVGQENRVIVVSDTLLVNGLKAGSCDLPQNLTIQQGVNLILPQWNQNLTFLQCPSGSSLPPGSREMAVISRNCSDGRKLYLMVNASDINSKKPGQSVITAPKDCRLVSLPVSSALLTSSLLLNTSSAGDDRWELLLKAVSDGFLLQWLQPEDCDSCIAKGGRCGLSRESGKVSCFSKDGCGQTKSNKRAIIIGIASGSSLFLMALSLLIFKKKISLFERLDLTKDKPMKDRVDTENFIKTYRSTLLTSYSYKEIKKMADSFKEKLGEGGYGRVYKGRLQDGRLVAVKVLDKSNSESQDFINEVATIGRIHHVNIINLFGFCLEGSKQALVYEYMPNGSLGDMLSKRGASLSLGMEKLLEIAVGIAHGITYLHRGCESRILHLDIKPQNILLDQDFTPKISDFGLAKVYSRHRSAVTLTGPKGTYGFIAPEIFMRNLGNPSDKSDVYSFGMLLLEMAGERTSNAETNKGSSSAEAYFPEWIYDRLRKEKTSIKSSHSVVEEDCLASRKMLMVGLWSIQVNPRDRPSMAMVVEMLSRSIEVLEMPPKPFFFSPPFMQQEEEHCSDGAESSSSLPLRLDSNES